MIYTVTMNPSLDYIISTKGFALGKTNRTLQEQLLPGGKGINVSIVLGNLGIESTALGFLAGFTGKEIEKRVKALGIASNFIFLEEGEARINVKLKEVDGTEINGRGPVILPEKQKELMEKLESLKEGDVLVLAGSIPESMPQNIYGQLLAQMEEKKVLCVVDAVKTLLLETLPYHPYLIKPNHHELGELFGVELHTAKEVIPYAVKLRQMGARNVLVSMAGTGAVFVDENDEIYEHPAPRGTVVNAVGAGDSMVAGFLAARAFGKSYREAFLQALAAGSASAFSEGFATKKEIREILENL